MSRKKLTGWKEIAVYLQQSVRTAQRWEQRLKLPVHRFAEFDNTPVFAFADELEHWLARTPVRERPYVRPIIILLDAPEESSISSRKLALEVKKYNVLTCFTAAEVLATAARCDADAVAVEMELMNDESHAICSSLKQAYPSLLLIGLFPNAEYRETHSCGQLVDRAVDSLDTDALINEVEALLGPARVQ